MPSALSEKGLQSLENDSAGVLLKHINIKGLLHVSIPPVITKSDCPMISSSTAK